MPVTASVINSTLGVVFSLISDISREKGIEPLILYDEFHTCRVLKNA
jgi:hypothetical protein